MSSNLQWILSAVQDFDISVSRAIELIECDRAGKFTDDMMPADARSRHIFALDDIPVVKYEELLAERDALAAKLAELEGQEPVAWMTANREMTSFVNFHDDDLPLFARPVHVEPVNARLLEAIKRLSFCAQTTGGTAGRDEELCAAIGEAEKAIAAAEAQQDRLLQDMHDAGREIDRVMAEAAPKAVLLTDEDLVDLFQAWNTTYGTSYADLIRAAETAVLERNGLNPQAKGD